MSSDDILRPSDYEFYRASNFPNTKYPSYDRPRSIEQLQLDLNRAHDNLKRQQQVNDKLYRELLGVRSLLERGNRRVRLLWTALGLTWTSWIGILWWLSKELAPVIVKGLGK